MAGLVLVAGAGLPAGAVSGPQEPAADSLVRLVPPDSTHWVRPIVVHASRIQPQAILDRLPGQAQVVELAPWRDRMTTTSEVLERVPGLHVSNYGILGDYCTVSIRGAGSGQVSVFLDGVPLGHAGLGVENLADLPFAGLERIEVYRGFAPTSFHGAGPAGVINLVTRGAKPFGPPMRRSAFLAGGGSYGTSRFGGSHEFRSGGWSGLLVADFLQSDGDFHFRDDNGTPLEPSDDEVVPRQNNWRRGEEVLLRLAHTLPGRGELTLLNSWVRREHGVPGLPSSQSQYAWGGTAYDVTSAEARWTSLAGGRLVLGGRLFHQWRRDSFADFQDLLPEIGLRKQDNRDLTRLWGTHLTLAAQLPLEQQASLDVELRREGFRPTQYYPAQVQGPEQTRRTAEAGVEDRLRLFERLELSAGLRLSWVEDHFAGDLRTPYSQRPARSGSRTDREPHLGFHLRLPAGFTLRAAGGRYHRTPGFLELFGNGGSVAGSSDLQPETGLNRDMGLLFDAQRAGLEVRLSGAVFSNRVDHWIVFLPQSQRIFVARNIGSAHVRGDEWSWRLAEARPAPRWYLEGGLTRLDARDLGVDIRWYAGKVLPGRPARQLHQRASLRLGRLELGYDYEHLGRNYLDRWNRDLVGRRDLHGIDARAEWHRLGLQLGLRNLTASRAADVAGFPLPGRTFFMTTTYTR